MGAQSGKDMLLKLDETGTGSFITVAGIRSRQLAFNAQSIDTTDSNPQDNGASFCKAVG